MPLRSVLWFAACLGSMTSLASAATPKDLFVTLREDLSKTLDEPWRPDSFTCILADAQAMDDKSKAVATLFWKTLPDIGVTDYSEIAFARSQLPLDSFTVKILWFTDAAKAAEFFRQKYRDHPDFTVVSETEVIGKQLGKRARLIGPISLSIFKLVRDDVATAKYLELATAQARKAIAP